MCDVPSKESFVKYEESAKGAAGVLAQLIQQKLDIAHVDPTALRLFLCAYWPRISKLAHTIHEKDAA